MDRANQQLHGYVACIKQSLAVLWSLASILSVRGEQVTGFIDLVSEQAYQPAHSPLIRSVPQT